MLSTSLPKPSSPQQQELGCAINMINMKYSYFQLFFSLGVKISVQIVKLSTKVKCLYWDSGALI